MSILNNSLLLGAPAATGYSISRSLRFNSADSAYLSRTPSVAGTSYTTWTWSQWVKRSALGAGQVLFSAGVNTNDYLIFNFEANDTLRLVTGENGTTNLNLFATTAVFRDPSAWYHIVLQSDTTNATQADRWKIYVNGIRQAVSGTIAAQNYAGTTFNRSGIAHNIARQGNGASYFNGYLADIHFIDGQALTPTSFGEFDINGIWQPKAFSGGSYGTNGFRLPFSDNSSNTATTLGKDTSGNGNNWTPNNLSVNQTTKNYSAGLVAYNSAVGTRTVLNPQNAFDGSLSTYSNGDYATSPGQNDYILCNFSPALTGVTSVRVWNWDGDTGGTQPVTVTINGQGSGITGGNGAYMRWYDMTSFLGGTTLSQVKVACGAIGGAVVWRTNFFAVEVNGVLLQNLSPADNDSLVDSPTNGTASSGGDAGGVVTGNYCTWNPLDKGSPTPSNGNLDVTGTNSHQMIRGTAGMYSGKWYWEVAINSIGTEMMIGIAKQDAPLSSYVGKSASGWAYWSANGQKVNNDSNQGYGATYTTGDVIGVAFDADNGTLTFYKNGSSQGQAYSGLTSGPYLPAISQYAASGSNSTSANFGQRPFAYAAPSGFKSLNTTNLPTPTILKGSSYFDTKLYTGNGSTQTIATDFSPDFIWVKERGVSQEHRLYDIIRNNTKLSSNDTAAENTLAGQITGWNATGFTVGAGSNGSVAALNESGRSYAAWCWDAGSSTVTNTAGSISAQVRANASAGFSIVTYTGNSTSGATVGHGLGVAPSLVIAKIYSTTSSWLVYHASLAQTEYLVLNSTAAKDSTINPFNDTRPTSTVVTLGGNVDGTNSGSVLMYCFAPVSGYSSFGSYTGNGSADGPFVYCGFRPRFILVKNTSVSGAWEIYDSARNTYNVMSLTLLPNASDAEINAANGVRLDFTSNGFKWRDSGSSINGSGNTIIWAAFAENPFSIARAR